MYSHAQKIKTSHTNKEEVRGGTTQFVDNRAENVAQRKLQDLANKNSMVQEVAQFKKISKRLIGGQKQSTPSKSIANPVVQKQPKDIPAPNAKEVQLMDLLNARNHAIVKTNHFERKGTHGTNWMHAISIMKGIKSQIPQEDRTSDVTPEDGGFFVDISESGRAHAKDFAEMAAYGTPTVEEGDGSLQDVMKNMKVNEQHQTAFNQTVKKGKGTRRAIILEIWGPKDAKPAAKKRGQQDDEHIYKDHAPCLVATLKDSL